MGAGASSASPITGYCSTYSDQLLCDAFTGDLGSATQMLKMNHIKLDYTLHSNGLTPLMMACREGHEDVVHALLERGAEVNTQTPNGVTALMQACRTGHTDIARTLVNYGARIDTRTKWGMAAVDWAHQCGDTEILGLLDEINAIQKAEEEKAIIVHRLKMNEDAAKTARDAVKGCNTKIFQVTRIMGRLEERRAKQKKMDECARVRAAKKLVAYEVVVAERELGEMGVCERESVELRNQRKRQEAMRLQQLEETEQARRELEEEAMKRCEEVQREREKQKELDRIAKEEVEARRYGMKKKEEENVKVKAKGKGKKPRGSRPSQRRAR
jgi:hypothetical protein